MDPIFEAYKQILRESIDLTNHKPKYTKEDKQAHSKKLAYKKIQDYIDSGSQGNLDLSNTQITSLPDNLKVGGDLYLSYTQITSLPDRLKVGGYLNLNKTPISKKYTAEELKRMLPGIKGKIYT